MSVNLYKKFNRKKVQLTLLTINAVNTFISLLFIPIASHVSVPSPFKIVLFIYSFVGLIYMLFYCANILAKKENNQNTLLQNLILLWFYPIGLWVIQPRINAIFKSKGNENDAFA
jgi:bacteriorhodopsin